MPISTENWIDEEVPLTPDCPKCGNKGEFIVVRVSPRLGRVAVNYCPTCDINFETPMKSQ